jgi:hypothetical protein
MTGRIGKLAVAATALIVGGLVAAANVKAAVVVLPVGKITASPPFTTCDTERSQFILDAKKTGCGGKVNLTGPGWATRAWPGLIGNDFWYLSFYDATTDPDSTSKASFYPGITVAGMYDVWISWRTSHNRATAVPFYIWADDGKTYKVWVNQKGTDGFRATKLGSFFFKAHARDKAVVTVQNNEGTHSKAVDALFLKYVGPRKPSGLQASDGTYAKKISLKWNPTADAVAYRIYRSSTTNIADAVQLPTVRPPSVSAEDLGLDEGATYNYWVRVVGKYSLLSKEYSNMDAGSTGVTPDTPVLDDNVVVDGNSINVQWGAVANADSYKVYRNSTNDAGTATYLATETAPTVEHTNSGLTSGTYWYFVTSLTGVIESSRSAGVSGTIQ